MPFHNFPLLPPEIRNTIWLLALYSLPSRTITIRSEVTSRILLPNNIADWTFRLVSDSVPPTLLHACRESRTAAQTRYTALFAYEPYLRHAWVDVQGDMVDIGTSTVNDWYKRGLDKVQRLKLHRKYEEWFEYNDAVEMKKMKQLRDVHVLCLDSPASWELVGGGFEWQLMKDNIWFIDQETGEMRNAEELYRRWGERMSGSFNPLDALR